MFKKLLQFVQMKDISMRYFIDVNRKEPVYKGNNPETPIFIPSFLLNFITPNQKAVFPQGRLFGWKITMVDLDSLSGENRRVWRSHRKIEGGYARLLAGLDRDMVMPREQRRGF